MRRVLLLTTPFDPRAHLDGTRRAVLDLLPELPGHDLAPWVLGREGAKVRGADVLTVAGPTDVFARVLGWLRPGDLVHAFLTPRRRTVLALHAIERRAPVLHTLTSTPVDKLLMPRMRRTIATSAWVGRGLDLPVIPMPFAPEPPTLAAPVKNLLLFAGDAREGGGLVEAAEAFRSMSPPWGVRAVLGVASRAKNATEVALARAVCEKTPDSVLLGELPSLLPHVTAARAVLLPASHTHAKLDHPRVLLEALSAGTRIVVGSAPTLAELLPDPSLGTVVEGISALREALEDALVAPHPGPLAVARVLSARNPRRVAAAYAALYERL